MENTPFTVADKSFENTTENMALAPALRKVNVDLSTGQTETMTQTQADNRYNAAVAQQTNANTVVAEALAIKTAVDALVAAA